MTKLKSSKINDKYLKLPSNESMHDIFFGAFKALKSIIYHEQAMLSLYTRISKYETNDLDIKLKELESKVLTEGVESEYFNELMKKVNILIFPKSFTSRDSEKVVGGNVDVTKELTAVNYFIDAPVELHILDMIFTAFIAEKKYENMEPSSKVKRISKYSYSNQVFAENFFKNIEEGICDYFPVSFFKPYSHDFVKWRTDAIREVNSKHKQSNIVLCTLDVSEYYYSVKVDFKKIKKWDDSELYDKICQIIEKMYSIHTQKLVEYNKIQDNKDICLPIGLQSSRVLGEVYLKEFDKNVDEFKKDMKMFHYGRYVDDMIFLLRVPKSSFDDYDEKCVMENLKYIIEKKENTEDYYLKISDQKSLKVSTLKTKLFKFRKGENPILLNVLNEMIGDNSSGADIYSSSVTLSSNYYIQSSNLYNVQEDTELKDLGFVKNDMYKTRKMMDELINASYLLSLEDVNKQFEMDETKNYEKKVNIFLKEFVRKSNVIEFYKLAIRIFVLYFQYADSNRIEKVKKCYEECISIISSYVVGEKYLNDRENEGKILIKSLKEHFYNSLIIAISSISFYNYNKVDDIEDFIKYFKSDGDDDEFQSSITSITNAHMISHNPVYNIFERVCGMKQINHEDFILFPRFINLNEIQNYNLFMKRIDPENVENELNLYKRLNYVDLDGDSKNLEHEKVNVDFEINDISFNVGNKKDSSINGVNIPVSLKSMHNTSKLREVKIGVVNAKVELEEKDMLSRIISVKLIEEIEELLGRATKYRVDIVVFPEFYLPQSMLSTIQTYVERNNVIIITGVEHIKYNEQKIMNTVVTIFPVNIGQKRSSLSIFREKNNYAPLEKLTVAKCGQDVEDKSKAIYNVYSIKNKGKMIRFSDMLCYEFTNIVARSIIKSKGPDILFVPQYNRDTPYFSNIVQSTCRDFHCFIVQSNTSEYGDSRVTAPYKTAFKDLLRVRGSEDATLLTSTLEIDKVHEYRKKYEKNMKEMLLMLKKCRTLSCCEIGNPLKECMYIKGKYEDIFGGKIKPPPKF